MQNRFVKYLIVVFFVFALSFCNEKVYESYFYSHDDSPILFMLDVGQGDSFLFITKEKKFILIDTGEGMESLSGLSSVFPYSINHIDTVILTHPDIDHIGGFEYILKRYDVMCLVLTSHTLDTLYDYGVLPSDSIEAFYTKEKDINQSRCFGDTSNVAFFNFTDGYKYPNDTNAGSIVTNITVDGVGYMFLGDAPSFILNDISDQYNFRCDVTTAGHHGSKNSVSKKLLAMCKPSVALISVGKDNSYGNPSKLALDSYSERGIKVLRTDESGTLEIKSDVKKVIVNKPVNKWFIFYNQLLALID